MLWLRRTPKAACAGIFGSGAASSGGADAADDKSSATRPASANLHVGGGGSGGGGGKKEADAGERTFAAHAPEDVYEHARVASLQRWLANLHGGRDGALSDLLDENAEAAADTTSPLWRFTGRLWDALVMLLKAVFFLYDALVLNVLVRARLVRPSSRVAVYPLRRRQRRQRRWLLQRRMQTARSFTEYYQTALELDSLEGGASWKLSRKDSSLYDRHAIVRRLTQMAQLYQANDMPRLMFCLRGSLMRHFSGISRSELHRHSRVGTKQEVDDFINVVSWLLDYIADEDSSAVTLQQKLSFFNEVRHAYGRTALLLSGGSTMGLSHFGALKALHEQRLLPRVLSGASAGAIVVSFAGVFTDAELPLCLEQQHSPISGKPFRFEIFDTSLTMYRGARRLAKRGVLFDVRRLQACMRENLGDITFQEAYVRTKRIINMTVTPQYGPPVLLNYLTAPNVLVWSAACASAALPLIFAPVELFAKDEHGRLVPYHPEGVRWTDGSLQADVPLQRIGEMFNVNHFIVSQANPHVIPRGSWLMKSRLAKCIKSELKFRYRQLHEFGVAPRLMSSLFPVITQPFEGDVTIMRDVSVHDLRRLFVNPSHDDIRDAVRRGERLTFAKLDEIRHNCLLEITLDGCIERMAHRQVRAAGQRGNGGGSGKSHAVATGGSGATGTARRLPSVPSWLWAEFYGGGGGGGGSQMSRTPSAASLGDAERPEPPPSPAPPATPLRRIDSVEEDEEEDEVKRELADIILNSDDEDSDESGNSSDDDGGGGGGARDESGDGEIVRSATRATMPPLRSGRRDDRAANQAVGTLPRRNTATSAGAGSSGSGSGNNDRTCPLHDEEDADHRRIC